MDELLINLKFNLETCAPKDAITDHRKIAYNKNIKPDISKRFGRLQLIGYDPDHIAVKYTVTKNMIPSMNCLCKCDCGNYIYARHTDLVGNKIRSCGCWHRENIENTIKGSRYIHGDTHTKLYNTLWKMINRCYNPNDISYKTYSAMGITICDEWYTPNNHSIGYLNFKKWAYENGYYDQPKDTPKIERLSIERIDPYGNYCPENCTWIPLKYQNLNYKHTPKIHIYGKDVNVSKWGKRINISGSDIMRRIHEFGWSEFDAATIPKRYARLQFGYDTTKNYDGPRYDEDGILRNRDGFIVLIKKGK